MIIDIRQPMGQGRVLAVESLEIDSGEHLVVLGPNGAGKTTLLRRLAGTLGGGPAVANTYLPQRPAALRGSARRNLELGLDESARRRAQDLAVELGIDGLLGASARSLSGGERQRLALARTLARAEPTVLLDEPLAGIGLADRPVVGAVVDRAIEGRTAVIVSHDRQTAAALGDRVAVLIDGSIRQLGSPAEVFALPADNDVATALGIANVMTGEVMDTDDALIALKVGALVVWGVGDPNATGRALFGAETVTLFADDHPQAGSARNAWSGKVTDIRPVGHLLEVLVDCGPIVVALVTPGAMAGLGLGVGDSAGVAVKATAVRIL
jgi:molybdopterin-binding protein